MTNEQIQSYMHAQIRTTGEPIFIVGFDGESGFVIVRRPIQNDNGITHTEGRFYPEELETFQQATDREIQQIVYRESAMQKAHQALAEQPKSSIIKPN